MALKHDAQGFLVGDPIDIGRALAVWDDIRADVRAIRRSVTEAGMIPSGGERAATVKAFNEIAQPMARSAPGRRDFDQVPALLRAPAVPRTGGTGGNAKRRDAQATAATDQAVAVVRAANQAARKEVAKPAARDSRGRFVRGAVGNGRSPASSGAGGRDGNSDEGVLRSIADRIAGAVKDSGAGLEEADPTVKAFNEIAQPMARGYELLKGGDGQKRQEGWLRRIYASLTGFRKDEGLFSKAARKSLKNIEDKPEGGESSGRGIWGTILSAIMGIGPAILAGIGALLSKIPGLGNLFGGGGSGAAGAAGSAAKGAGGFFKGALKKIPLLGSLLAVGGAAADIYGSENDDNLSRREKDKNAGKAIGGAGGTIGGMMAGAAAGAFAGPIGMAIGGMVGAFLGDQAGQIIGDTVGGWVNDLRNADIPGKISAAWDSVVAGFKSAYETIGKTWQGFVDSAKAGWDTIANLFKSAYEGLKSLPIIGPAIQAVEDAAKKTAAAASAAADAAKQKAVEVGTKAVEKGKEVAQAAKEKAVDVGTKAVEGVKQGAEYLGNNTTIGKGVKAAGNWVLGQTSKLFESGKGGAATASSGKGDYGGASYGTYQLSSSQGTLQNFLKSSKYGEQFAGLQPGTPEFNAKWKEVAKADPEFGNAQHDFIKQTHFDPQMAKLAKGGIDLSGRGAAVQDAVWSTSVQFGGKSSLIEKALAGKDVSKLSDTEIVSAIQDYKVANNDKLFAKSSGAVREGTAKRATDEKKRLLALADQDASANAASMMQGGTQVATAAAQPPAQSTPAAPAVAQSPSPPAAPVVAAPVVASASIPRVPSMPSVQAVAEAPQISVPMASNSSRQQVIVASSQTDAGQDLRERGIAHIVTGGLST